MRWGWIKAEITEPRVRKVCQLRQIREVHWWRGQ